MWVETDSACEVGVLGCREKTFCIDGHHYALVVVEGLEPGACVPYTVELDGRRAWPEDGDDLPAPVIRTFDGTDHLRVVFGSCRVSLPHEPPFALDQADDEQGQGVDALRTMALALTRKEPSEWPALLLMLGDQVYADDLSPAMRAVTERHAHPEDAPEHELASFDEYALAYREAWSERLIRWLLSVIPTAMVFDDHEIHAEWKISRRWEERMRGYDWYPRRIADGLAAYWIYQHLGNLSPTELAANDCYERVRRHGDGADQLRRDMRNADEQPGHSRFSFCRDLGHSRLVVIDSRAGRVLDPENRQMIDEGEWEWVEDKATGDFEHLLLASSVPFLLVRGLHDLEASVEALTEGRRGKALAGLGERVREGAVLDHWAAFQRSFRRLAQLLEDVATGERGDPPRTVIMLSGDVHHCYLAEVGFASGTNARSSVWQAVCSAYRKQLEPREKKAMKLGNSGVGRAIGRALLRLTGAELPAIGWRLLHDPNYDNQVGVLELSHDHAQLHVLTSAGADWREPVLQTVFERRLDG